MTEIFLVIITLSIIVGTPFFILKIIRTAIGEGISQGKQNITININPNPQKSDPSQISAILQNLQLSEPLELLQIFGYTKTDKSRSGKNRNSCR